MGARGFILVAAAVRPRGGGRGLRRCTVRSDGGRGGRRPRRRASSRRARAARMRAQGPALGPGGPGRPAGNPLWTTSWRHCRRRQRQELENNPEAAAMARAQIQMAIDSGMIPPEALQQLAGGGAVEDAPDAAAAEGARNAEPLAGTVASFERRDAPAGDAGRRGCDHRAGRRAGERDEGSEPTRRTYLVEGAEVSVIARPDDSGGLAAAVGHRGRCGHKARAAVRGFGGLAAVVTGSINVVRGRRADAGDGGRSGGVRRWRMRRRCGSPTTAAEAAGFRVGCRCDRDGVRAARGGRQPVGGKRERWRRWRRLRPRAVRRRSGWPPTRSRRSGDSQGSGESDG